MEAIEIVSSLKQDLPARLHQPARMLAEIIEATINGNITTNHAQEKIAQDQALIEIIERLAGKQMILGETTLSFGNGNQMGNVEIRDVAGRDIINVVVEINNSPRDKTIKLKEARARQELIARIKSMWISNVLHRSLHMESDISNTFQRAPFSIIFEKGPNDDSMTFQHDINTMQLFDAVEGMLLIVGPSGSGKSTLLLEIALHLLERAEQNESYPIPLVIHLGTWSTPRDSFGEWLLEHIFDLYDLKWELSRKWLEEGRFALLFDGFDEISPEYFRNFEYLLYNFRRDYGVDQIVLCSTEKPIKNHGPEYYRLRFGLHGILRCEYLTKEQIINCIGSCSDHKASICQLILESGLVSFIRTPLMLCLTLATYS